MQHEENTLWPVLSRYTSVFMGVQYHDKKHIKPKSRSQIKASISPPQSALSALRAILCLSKLSKTVTNINCRNN